MFSKVVSKPCSLEPKWQCPRAHPVGSETSRLSPPPSHSFDLKQRLQEDMHEGNEKGFCYENAKMRFENYGPKDRAKLVSRPVPEAS